MLGGDKASALAAGLPEITGGFNIMRAGPSSFTGALYGDSGNQGWGAGSNDLLTSGNIYFDASRCSLIYGNSETVMPLSFALIPQIKI